MVKEFKLQISGDWYGGILTITADTIEDASFQLASMFGECHGQINILEPQEYAHKIWDERLKVFMTYQEHQEVQGKLSEISEKFYSRNKMYVGEETFKDFFD